MVFVVAEEGAEKTGTGKMFPIIKLDVTLVTVDFSTMEIAVLKDDQNLYSPGIKIYIMVRGFDTGRKKKKRKYRRVVIDPVDWQCYLVKFIHKKKKKQVKMKPVTAKMLRGKKINAKDVMVTKAVEAAKEKIEECLA